MDVLEMRTHTQDFLQTSSTDGFWSDAEILRYLNIGHRKMHQWLVLNAQRFFATTRDLDETINISLYALPADLFQMTMLERLKSAGGSPLVNPVPLTKIQPTVSEVEDFRLRTNDDSYHLQGQKAFKLSVASTTTQTASIRCHYAYRPLELVEDTDLPFRKEDLDSLGNEDSSAIMDDLEDYHDIIPLYAIRWCLAKEEAMQQLPFVEGEIRARLTDLQNSLINIDIQSPRGIHAIDDDGDMSFDFQF